MNRGIVVFFAKLIQSIPWDLFKFLEWPLVQGTSTTSKDAHRHIFILAVPRSGSTLLYQCLCHYFSVNYLSNVWNVFYKLPFLGGMLSGKICLAYKSNFQSNFGFVTGLSGPAEGYKFWKYWLNCYLDERSLSGTPFMNWKLRVDYLRNVLAIMYLKTGRPFATAFLGHTLTPHLVSNSFPDSLFIVLRRDPVAVAHSLLIATRLAGQRWFSLVPRECVDLNESTEHERVAAQVYWLYSRLYDFSVSHNVYFVDYEDLCTDPNLVFANLHEWLISRNLNVKIKFALPSKFRLREGNIADDPDIVAIREAYCNISRLNGSLWEIENNDSPSAAHKKTF